MNVPALYAIVVGLLIFAVGVLSDHPASARVETQRMPVLFHIAGEFLTAAVLIANGALIHQSAITFQEQTS